MFNLRGSVPQSQVTLDHNILERDTLHFIQRVKFCKSTAASYGKHPSIILWR